MCKKKNRSVAEERINSCCFCACFINQFQHFSLGATAIHWGAFLSILLFASFAFVDCSRFDCNRNQLIFALSDLCVLSFSPSRPILPFARYFVFPSSGIASFEIRIYSRIAVAAMCQNSISLDNMRRARAQGILCEPECGDDDDVINIIIRRFEMKSNRVNERWRTVNGQCIHNVYNYISRVAAIWRRQFALLTNIDTLSRPKATNLIYRTCDLFAYTRNSCPKVRNVFRWSSSSSECWNEKHFIVGKHIESNRETYERNGLSENRDRPRGHRVADDKRNRDAAIKTERQPQNGRRNNEMQTPRHDSIPNTFICTTRTTY